MTFLFYSVLLVPLPHLSGRSLLPQQQQRQQQQQWQQRWRADFKQTQCGSNMGPGSQPQLLRELEGGTSSTAAQRQLCCHQEPRETKLLVQSGACPVTKVRRIFQIKVNIFSDPKTDDVNGDEDSTIKAHSLHISLACVLRCDLASYELEDK